MPISISKGKQRVFWLLVAGGLLAMFLQWAIPALIAFGIGLAAFEAVKLILLLALFTVVGTGAAIVLFIFALYIHWLFFTKDQPWDNREYDQ